MPDDEPVGLRERKKLRARRAIRAAALELFAQQGYESVRVEQTAAAAEVSRTTFFNYFHSKEAVVTEPDPQTLAAQRLMCLQRPADEPLWQALSAVLLTGLRQAEDDITVQKLMKTTSPAMATIMHRSSERTIEELRDWVASRVPRHQRRLALLQLNVAVAAVATAFEQWELDQPFEAFAKQAKHYLERLDRSFD